MSSGAQLRLAGAACDTCPARHGTCVLPEPALRPGGSPPLLAVVGEAPSRADVEAKKPFAGASGRLLQRGLRTLRMARNDVHWTNAVLCECKEQDQKAARAACAQRLRSELEACGAPVVMPLGPSALHSSLALPRRPQILKWRGSVSRMMWSTNAEQSSPALGDGAAVTHTAVRSAFVLPTIHPAFVMRAPKWGPVLEVDVARIGRVLEHGFTPPEDAPGRRLVVPKSFDALEAALAELGEDNSFDVETVGLGPCYTALVCFGLSDGQLTVVVPWSTEANGLHAFWREPARVAELVSRHMARMVIVTHNGPAFDHIVAARYGLVLPQRREDTLLIAHATAGHMPKNLAHVVTLYLDVPPWKQLEDRGADIARLHVYNGRDCLYTQLAYQEAKKELST